MNMLNVPKREAKRSRVFLTAQVNSQRGPIEVRIRDISRSGALLEADVPPAIQSSIRIRCGDSLLKGRVAWSDKCWFGVEFDAPLAIGFLADQTGARIKVSAPRSYRANDELPLE